MTEVPTRATDDEMDDARPAEQPGIETVESYETEESVVFYDSENPLAWVEATRTLQLDELA